MVISIKEYRSVIGSLENGGLYLCAVRKAALFGALFVIFTASHLFAAEQTNPTHEDSEHYHRNNIGFFFGNTYEDSHHGSENGLTVGFNYERRLSKLLGIGGFYEYAGGDFDKWSIDIKGDQGPLSVKFQNTSAEVDGLYRFMSGEHNLDFLFGLRYTDQET